MDTKRILDFIRLKSDRPMKIKELAGALSVPREEYRNFRKAVRGLIDSGELVRLKRNRIGLAAEMNIVVGKLSVTRGGTGFVTPERSQEKNRVDIMIPSTQLLTAFDGDKVMIRLAGFRGNRQAGSVIRVIQRTDRNIVGVFHRGRHFSSVMPDNPRIHRDIYIPNRERQGARDGEKVVVALVEWDDPHVNPEGRILERLGFPNDPGVDMLTIIKSHNLPQEFPDEILAEAELAGVMPDKRVLKERVDMTRECVYTIDPKEAKDHDDAVSVEKTSDGYRLGVHIADVSYFVQPNTILDKEAFRRGNSVYLPGMVIPMLPEVLSNNVCSLKPNRRRLAHSVLIDIDKKGRMLKWELADTIIRSRAKLSYEEVQDFFDTGRAASPRIERVAESLTMARDLAGILSKHRFAEGSLDFDLPEARLTLNARGEVLELSTHVRLEAHRLVEEFMLAANRAVALEVFRSAQPFIYRIHDKPDQEKIEEFSAMMTRLGYRFSIPPDLKPIHFSRFLERVKDKPEADFINELMLRSMKKAVYQRKNIGHFGLAFKHYTHFTSPIRRYPDLLVHRLLRRLKGGRYPAQYAKRVVSIIDHVGRYCSDTERTAEVAEREAIKVKQVAYMVRHVGDEYSGVISGVASFGFFVRLDGLGVEGVVRMSTIDDDYYRYEEKAYRIIGSRRRRVYRMGDSVRVGVLKVDTVRSEIDFHLIEKPVTKKQTGKKDRSKRYGRKRRGNKNKGK
ncbi:MAG: ribonuclease R [candidate division Zixibacteria bacterium]|nr:ribonuclease R [candidate division Zixibacteria bacterium]